MTELTEKQELAIAALLSSATIGAAATKVGVTARTLNEWGRQEHFAAAYREARRQAVNQAIARLQRSSSDAVAVLCTLMKSTRVAPAVRLAAASKVLDLAIRAVELEDVMARLEALEAKHAQKL